MSAARDRSEFEATRDESCKRQSPTNRTPRDRHRISATRRQGFAIFFLEGHHGQKNKDQEAVPAGRLFFRRFQPSRLPTPHVLQGRSLRSSTLRDRHPLCARRRRVAHVVDGILPTPDEQRNAFGKQMEICSLGPRTGFLACSKKFDPSLFISESWSAAEEDERANELAEIDVSMIALVTGLKKDEKYITGEEAVKRLKETPYIRLGGRAFLALWENQRLVPESWKEQFVFVSFDGLILLHRNGNRYSVNLSWDGVGWHWYTGWLGNNRSARNTSAVLAN